MQKVNTMLFICTGSFILHSFAELRKSSLLFQSLHNVCNYCYYALLLNAFYIIFETTRKIKCKLVMTYINDSNKSIKF